MESYKSDRVALANSPGIGVSDDKAIYAYSPKIINHYLAEEPILPNVPTYLCSDQRDRTYVLEHLDQLVVKATCIAVGKVSIHQHGCHSMFLMTSGLRSVRDKAVTYFDEAITEGDQTFDKLFNAVNVLPHRFAA